MKDLTYWKEQIVSYLKTFTYDKVIRQSLAEHNNLLNKISLFLWKIVENLKKASSEIQFKREIVDSFLVYPDNIIKLIF